VLIEIMLVTAFLMLVILFYTTETGMFGASLQRPRALRVRPSRAPATSAEMVPNVADKGADLVRGVRHCTAAPERAAASAGGPAAARPADARRAASCGRTSSR